MATMHDVKDMGGIAVADRPVPRWIVALAVVVVGWVVYYMVTFGTQSAGRFPRPEEQPGGGAAVTAGQHG